MGYDEYERYNATYPLSLTREQKEIFTHYKNICRKVYNALVMHMNEKYEKFISDPEYRKSKNYMLLDIKELSDMAKDIKNKDKRNQGISNQIVTGIARNLFIRYKILYNTYRLDKNRIDETGAKPSVIGDNDDPMLIFRSTVKIIEPRDIQFGIGRKYDESGKLINIRITVKTKHDIIHPAGGYELHSLQIHHRDGGWQGQLNFKRLRTKHLRNRGRKEALVFDPSNVCFFDTNGNKIPLLSDFTVYSHQIRNILCNENVSEADKIELNNKMSNDMSKLVLKLVNQYDRIYFPTEHQGLKETGGSISDDIAQYILNIFTHNLQEAYKDYSLEDSNRGIVFVPCPKMISKCSACGASTISGAPMTKDKNYLFRPTTFNCSKCLVISNIYHNAAKNLMKHAKLIKA